MNQSQKRFVKFIEFVSNGSRLTKTNFVFGFIISLDSGLLENFFCAFF